MKTTDKTAEFLDEYEVLCRKYGMVLEPEDQCGLTVEEAKTDAAIASHMKCCFGIDKQLRNEIRTEPRQ